MYMFISEVKLINVAGQIWAISNCSKYIGIIKQLYTASTIQIMYNINRVVITDTRNWNWNDVWQRLDSLSILRRIRLILINATLYN